MVLAFEIKEDCQSSQLHLQCCQWAKGVILSFYSGEPRLEYWVQVWASQYKMNAGTLERVHQRAAKLMKGLEHLPSLRLLGAVQPGDKRSWGVGSRQCV